MSVWPGDVGAAMVHNPADDAGDLLVSRSVHSRGEALAARGADLVFVSPVFASASHPGGAVLGMEAALALAQLAGAPAIALGGMDQERGEAAMAAGFHGWAAIDAWLRTRLSVLSSQKSPGGRPIGARSGPRRSELEGGPDVDGLAVAALVGEGRDAVLVDAVANAAGDRDAAVEVVGGADIDRDIVGLRQSGDAAVAAVGADARPGR